jgi:hypothetical protein
MKKFMNSLREIPLFAFIEFKIKPYVIPSFVFHKVIPREFEAILLYLKTNNYRTLSIKEYYDYLICKRQDNDKKVILTFDDGLRNNWSVVFPLLRKYGMKAVFYITPANIDEKISLGPNSEGVLQNELSKNNFDNFELKHPFISWDEARVMEKSGLVNIESHAMQHQICFVEDKIIDFQHPDKRGKPVYPWLFSAFDMEPGCYVWGAPVYPYKPRFTAMRFFDDYELRKVCISYVKENGGVDFFLRNNWKKKLFCLVNDYKANNKMTVRFEDEIEQEISIRDSLLLSKQKIEKELNKQCLHFAFPWNISGDLSILWLKELGFLTVFRFTNPFKMPMAGSDLYRLNRIEGYWIPALPGKGRISIWDKFVRKIIL